MLGITSILVLCFSQSQSTPPAQLAAATTFSSVRQDAVAVQHWSSSTRISSPAANYTADSRTAAVGCAAPPTHASGRAPELNRLMTPDFQKPLLSRRAAPQATDVAAVSLTDWP